ncbi:Hsp33 family molecular chaperone HslO [Lachnospiraceae bacterium 38-14]|jgi:Disulfide bond chaperones of the HSP33 family|uniref:Hsp33 family molecular chaperone HslO n=1 Tax=Roseburia sp. 1XD42-69 TaxID=2320088 RepID=UPI000EA095EE|nr:Hsp33 family molecular chaperone HslO [Roseburia sp. 1XD42-69]MCX4319096.1 Hsp33 family molecular chaperone HslO [Lachnospiraceae bacterium]RKJ63021.1 Hsp33 family molecular chaperone HslO [Roseburia sp. 1XD42-69]
MSDYMVRATAAEGQIRIFAVTAKDLVESAKNHHNTSPVMTAALGRLLMGGVMMGAMMKGEKDILTIQIQCSGPAKGLMVTSDAQGHVKGYPFVNDVILPANDKGKLDVGHALDLGVMSVIKDIGMKEPYVGQVALQTGEIGDDLTYYFATSEQIPSSVGLGVLMNKDNTVRAAGGFILQLMPFAKEELIDDIEKKIESLQSVTSLIEKGETPEELLGAVLKGIEFEVTDTLPVEFRCDCSKERILKSLATLPGKDLDDLISGGEGIEVKCQFCNTAYQFETEDLKEIRS